MLSEALEEGRESPLSEGGSEGEESGDEGEEATLGSSLGEERDGSGLEGEEKAGSDGPKMSGSRRTATR